MAKTTAKVNCSCEHIQQDKMYGKNVRIANITQKRPAAGSVEVRCTVCSKKHTVSEGRLL